MAEEEVSREERLATLGIHPVEKDLRTMDQAELAERFGAASSGRIVLKPLIRNIIWQAYTAIQAGEEEPVTGNIRTFWYRFVKPVLSHMGDDDALKTDPYDVMLYAFAEMVMEHRLFSYADFDFTDENWENRRIGVSHPHIVVFAEKTGWVRFLREIHEKWSVTTLALGGAPSVLTSEYTARDMQKAIGEETRRATLVGIVDYDPAGQIIAEAFVEQLAAFGFPDAELHLLVRPEHYTAEQLEMYRYPLSPGRPTTNAKWLEATGGIAGQAYGLEAESMPLSQLRGLVGEWLARVTG